MAEKKREKERNELRACEREAVRTSRPSACPFALASFSFSPTTFFPDAVFSSIFYPNYEREKERAKEGGRERERVRVDEVEVHTKHRRCTHCHCFSLISKYIISRLFNARVRSP